MEIEEIKKNENPLIKRKELVLKVTNESVTPTKNELTDKISSQYNVDKKLVVLEKIKTTFGGQDCDAYVKLYDSADVLKKTEPQSKEKEEAKKPANVPDDSGQIKVDIGDSEKKPADETPAEEKKEEKKEEPAAEDKKEE